VTVHHEEDTYSSIPAAKYCGNNTQKASAGRDEHRPPPLLRPQNLQNGRYVLVMFITLAGGRGHPGWHMDGDGCESHLEVGGERGASSAASTVTVAAAAVVAPAAASYPPTPPLPLICTMHRRRGQEALGCGGACRRRRVCCRVRGDGGGQRSEAGRVEGGARRLVGLGEGGRAGEEKEEEEALNVPLSCPYSLNLTPAACRTLHLPACLTPPSLAAQPTLLP